MLTALAQQEVEQLVLLVVHHRDLAGQRDLDGALAPLLEGVGVGLELVAAGVAAGEGPALVADMLVEDGRREAKGAGIDRLAEQRLDLRRLVGCGRALHRGLAHHVVAERGQGRQEAQVERRAPSRRRLDELGKGLPVPGDAHVEDVEGNRLDVHQVAHGHLARLGLARRDAHAAVAHDDAGDAVPRRRGDRPVPEDLRVVVGVRVDEARRHHEVGGIDHGGGPVRHASDLGDRAARNRHIGPARRRPRAVHQHAVLDHQVVGHQILLAVCFLIR